MDRSAPPRSSRTVAIDGNRLTLLTEGPDLLEAILALIDGAKSSLRLLYYTYSPDRSGERVRGALLRAAERGVRVSLLVDDFGSSDAPDGYFSDLRQAGVALCRFHPSLGRRYLLRNHQKMLLADESTVLIGGFNIDDDYFATVEQGGWRDIGLIVEGPAAARLTPYFDELFAWSNDRHSRIRDLRKIILRHSESSGRLQWQLGGPMRRLSPWAVSTCRDLAQGCDVELIAAYFAPTGGMLKRIARLGSKGRARLITAAKSDNTATIAAARFTYNRLLKRGVEIFEYQPTKLHSKLMVLDDEVHIGSSNFDIRSLYLNMELMLRVEDAEFASMTRFHFESELDDCVPVTRESHARKATLLNKIRWALSFFLVTTADYAVTRRLNFGAE